MARVPRTRKALGRGLSALLPTSTRVKVSLKWKNNHLYAGALNLGYVYEAPTAGAAKWYPFYFIALPGPETPPRGWVRAGDARRAMLNAVRSALGAPSPE